MALRRIGWLLLEGLSLTCFFWFGSGWALALAIVLAAVPLAVLPANLMVRKNLEARVHGPSSLQKGTTVEVTLELRNPTRLPAPGLGCTVRVENRLNGQCIRQKLTLALPPKGQCARSLHLRADYAGTLRITLEKVRLYDWFGLLGLGCPCTAGAWAAVQPDTFPMEVFCGADSDPALDSEQYAQNRPGTDLTEIWQLRDYVPGDSPRQVHWKLSEKYDRLIVRDPGLPIERNVLLFWERTGSGMSARDLDAQAEAVVSLCRALADMAIPFRLGWNDPEENRCQIREIPDMDTLAAVLPRLLGTPGGRGESSGAELLLQTRQDALCGHMIYLGRQAEGAALELPRFGRTTYLLSGPGEENGIRFTPDNYSKVLSRLEI